MILAEASPESPMSSPISIDWWGTIKEVTNPYALLAFLIAAGLTALLIVLQSTGGLKAAQESVLKNAQLTGAQFESIVKFTILSFASLAVCLLVFLSFNVWLNRQSSTTSTVAPQISIAFPAENQTIEVSKANQGFSPITLRGTSSNIPRNERIWIFSSPFEANRTFPFQTPATVEVDGDWSSSGVIGPIDKPNIQYEFLVVGVDENARYALNEYLKQQAATKQYVGFETLPDGSNVYSRREVTFTPKGGQ